MIALIDDRTLLIVGCAALILAALVAGLTVLRARRDAARADKLVAVGEVSRDWQPTWRINAVADPWVMENEKDDIPSNFVLRVEETRMVRDIGGGEVVEIRWRQPTKAEVREIVRRYHAAQNDAKPPLDTMEFQKHLHAGASSRFYADNRGDLHHVGSTAATLVPAPGPEAPEHRSRLLDRIATHDQKLHAFVALYPDEARLAAEAADKAIRAGHAVGPLHGIPIALKDLIEIEGRVTTGGSKVWQDRLSTTTATLVRKVKAAGMIVIGKTHSVEFAMGGWGTNQYMGTPWNPWDLKTPHTPGGSSSGAGVAVAARLVPCAIGTDTGGSVRMPASWCGIVGLKATVGRISTYGILPLAPTLDTPGPMTRSVEDAAILFNILQGLDPLDDRTSGRPAADPIPSLRRGVAGLRLAVLPEGERTGVDQEVLAAYDDSVEVLRGLGAQIVNLDLPRKFSDFAELTGQIIGAEGYTAVGDIVDRLDLPVDDAVRPRIWIGKSMSARDYLRALAEREKLTRQFAGVFANIDALLTPTTATPPIPIAAVDQSRSPAVFTRMVNLLDLCALSLPNGFTSAGLPTSLQIVCRGYDEGLALRIGWAYEHAVDWLTRLPPMF